MDEYWSGGTDIRFFLQYITSDIMTVNLIPLPLTVSGLHQLGVAVLWRLSLGRGAGARASLHLDPIAGGGVGGVVGVAGDIWRGRVVLWV